ncbi:MAG: glycosyltransferase family 4 protein [Gaiellaceae bacterium]
MKILLNLTATTWLGGRYYLENLARALSTLDEPARPQLVVNADDAEFAGLAEVADRLPDDADVIFPNWGFSRTPGIAQVHWIPDLQHRALPEYFSRGDRVRRDIGYRRLARRADLVVVSSEHVREAVATAYRSAVPKLRVLHFRTVVPSSLIGADPREVISRHRLPDEFLLLPNQFWSHKNHATAFAAVADLPLPVVCTGETTDHRRPHAFAALLDGLRDRGLEDRVRILGVVPRNDYLQLVRASAAILQPSLFEGWSSIVEDARAFGKPIALSDIAVHREQSPPGSFFFSPRDPSALARAARAATEHRAAPQQDALATQRELVRQYAREFVAIAAEAASARQPISGVT